MAWVCPQIGDTGIPAEYCTFCLGKIMDDQSSNLGIPDSQTDPDVAEKNALIGVARRQVLIDHDGSYFDEVGWFSINPMPLILNTP